MQKILYIAIATVLCAILGYSFWSESGVPHKDVILEKRFEKERYFLQSPQSPFKNKELVKRLAYFAPNKAFCVQASVQVLENRDEAQVKMSGGEVETYLRYAYLEFSWQGKPYKLLALRKSPIDPHLWVGFRDATSGKTSYGGGRYLDLDYRNGQTSLTLDFNLAYNPYCAYSPDFTCPLPPKENNLPIAIEAGEKDFQK